MKSDGERLGGMSQFVEEANTQRAGGKEGATPNAANSPRRGRNAEERRRGVKRGHLDFCPACGAWLCADEIALVNGVASAGGKTVALSPFLASILALMLKKQGRAIRRHEITLALWNYAEGPVDEINAVNVHLTRLRKRLSRIGWTVVSTAPGAGWTARKINEA